MAPTVGPPEEILLYYKGTSELNPPQPYMPTKVMYQDAGNGVFLLTLNDPKRLNCMSLNLAMEVVLLIEHAKRDDRCKVAVWTGAGRLFSAGGNFTDTSSTVPEDVFAGYIHAGVAVSEQDISAAGPTRAMLRFPKFSIVAINGAAIGGGANMALVWHDYSIAAAEKATFRYPFAELGLVPELGSSILLPRLIGLTRTREMLQLGTEFDAKKAHELGLVNEVVPADKLLDRAMEVANKMASVPQAALRESKRLLNAELVGLIDKVTADELKTFQACFHDPETQKAIMKLTAKTAKPASKL